MIDTFREDLLPSIDARLSREDACPDRSLALTLFGLLSFVLNDNDDDDDDDDGRRRRR